MERKCPWCGEEVPEGTVGRFCSTEHKWLDARRDQPPTYEQQLVLDLVFPVERDRSTAVWGRSPRGR